MLTHGKDALLGADIVVELCQIVLQIRVRRVLPCKPIPDLAGHLIRFQRLRVWVGIAINDAYIIEYVG